MPGKREMFPDWTKVGEKCLGATRVAKTAHLPFAAASGLMAILGPVVHACRSIDEHVFDAGKLGNLGLCGRIASQLIGDTH